MARPRVDLPEPNSPTMPSFSRPSVKLTPRTAFTLPPPKPTSRLVGLNQGRSHWPPRASSTSRRASPNRLKARLTRAMAMPGAAMTHGLSIMNSRPVEAMAPHSGHGRYSTEAEEAEAGRGQDDARHVECDAHDHRRHAHRQDMPQDDRPGRRPLQPDGGDEVCLPEAQRLGACQSRNWRPGGQRNGDDRIGDAGAKRGCKAKRQHQARERQENIGDAHQNFVHPAAKIAGAGTDQQADGRHDNRDQYDDIKCRASAIDDARIDVAPEFVGAQQMFPRRRRKAARHVLRDRVIAGQKRRADGDHDQQHDDRPGRAIQGDVHKNAASSCRVVARWPGCGRAGSVATAIRVRRPLFPVPVRSWPYRVRGSRMR